MTVAEIKQEIATLSREEKRRLSAYFFWMEVAESPECRATVARRTADKDPTHWHSLEEVKRRLGEK